MHACMHMQFIVIWRFFRLAALVDGVEVPENMTRCMSNNCDIEVSPCLPL